ncbi:MAG: hypothetical protein WC307_02635 [Candidatus Nanoarchaeia archaeon]|jgi:hypothetical protein
MIKDEQKTFNYLTVSNLKSIKSLGWEPNIDNYSFGKSNQVTINDDLSDFINNQYLNFNKNNFFERPIIEDKDYDRLTELIKEAKDGKDIKPREMLRNEKLQESLVSRLPLRLFRKSVSGRASLDYNIKKKGRAKSVYVESLIITFTSNSLINEVIDYLSSL